MVYEDKKLTLVLCGNTATSFPVRQRRCCSVDSSSFLAKADVSVQCR